MTQTVALETPPLALGGGPKAVSEPKPYWPYLTDDEIEAVRANLVKGRTDWSYMCAAGKGGPGQALEERVARDLGVPFVAATAGGGPALHIACMATLEMGDEAIVTPYSWGQTVSCILQAGGVPVFADIDPRTLTLDPKSVEAKVTPRTKAIVVVHIGGMPADLDGLLAVARKHGLALIEDCAQAQGSRYKGREVGTFGDYGCFSLGSGKNIAAGEAGLLVARTRDHYERALLCGMHPMRNNVDVQDPARRAWIDSLIYTYRVNALSAGLAVKQMDRLDELNAHRRRAYAQMAERLAGVPGIRALSVPEDRDPAWHMGMWTFVPEEVEGVTRAQFLKALQAEGVPIGGSYVGTPIHLRPTFAQKKTHFGRGYPWAAHPQGDAIVYRAGDCPVAERRCAVEDLTMLGGGCWKDVTPLLDQIAAAFRKVAARLDEVRGIQA
ncbi:MAG: DegT/DnrJ/EryC1/StrS family aminotransferase [Planctomycetota bacterium]|nr:DegT/DnrJ/EryC1/StrS family aminotransferase [Planctomycetota bacterium]